MNGQPNRFCARLRDPMLYMARDCQIIALVQFHLRAVKEFHSRRAAHYNYPFVAFLIVPEIPRASMRVRNNAFDLGMDVFKQSQKLFTPIGLRNIGE